MPLPDFLQNWTALGPVPLATGRRQPLRARFIERPHRFAAICRRRGGETVAAHVPNPGRLTGVIAPGSEVLLDGPFPPPRSLVYTMLASRAADTWVGTNTMYANRVFPSLVEGGLLPELEAGEIRREVAHGRSRFDFRIGSMFVEVKSVTLADGDAARFPDAVSTRAARHCEELAGLARAGQRGAIVFVAQRGDVASVSPEDDVDPAFGIALRNAARAGVLVLACTLDLTPLGVSRARRISIRL
jgi:sugar fermentation stimulation protein A